MLITNGDDILSRAVLNMDRNQNSIWKNAVRGDAPEELKAEWWAVSACGFGNPKAEPSPSFLTRFLVSCYYTQLYALSPGLLSYFHNFVLRFLF